MFVLCILFLWYKGCGAMHVGVREVRLLGVPGRLWGMPIQEGGQAGRVSVAGEGGDVGNEASAAFTYG